MEGKKKKEVLWDKNEIKLFKSFKNPYDIQLYLNKLKYNPKNECKSPRRVIKEGTAHCTEGAFFAAAALRFLGYEPLVVYMIAHNDDDHLIAVFKKDSFWGAVAKSNYTVLRYREPVYRSIRELVMSYFDFFFNTLGEKTLRAYTIPLNLKKFDKYNWMTTDEDISFIADHLDRIKRYKILDKKQISSLNPVDKSLLKAGLFGSVKEGLFKPIKTKCLSRSTSSG